MVDDKNPLTGGKKPESLVGQWESTRSSCFLQDLGRKATHGQTFIGLGAGAGWMWACFL